MNDHDLTIKLILAAKKGDLALCKDLIAAGANVNGLDANGSTALHQAAGEGHTEVCQWLIDLGANVNAQSKNGSTPIHCSVWNAHAKACEILINHGTDVMAKNEYQRTPLHTAAAANSARMCDLLVKHGADVMAKDEMKKTPMHSAIESGSKEAFHYFIQSSAWCRTLLRDRFDELNDLATQCQTIHAPNSEMLIILAEYRLSLATEEAIFEAIPIEENGIQHAKRNTTPSL